MLKIKFVEDCNVMPKGLIKEFLKNNVLLLRNGEDGYYKEHPEFIEDMSYDILIDNKCDNLKKGVPHLNDSEEGLFCKDGNGNYGWCWEAFDYHPEIGLFEIIICMNDALCIGYWIPNDSWMNPEIKRILCEKLNIEIPEPQMEYFQCC